MLLICLYWGATPPKPPLSQCQSRHYYSDGFIKRRSCSFSLFQCARAHNDLIPCFHTNLHLISRLIHLPVSTRFLLVSYSFLLVSTHFYSFPTRFYSFLLVALFTKRVHTTCTNTRDVYSKMTISPYF